MPIASLKNVSYVYPHAPAGAVALSGVTLAVEEGEFVAVVGANGSGKSTLARLLSGLLAPDSGEVSAFGVETGAHDDQSSVRYNKAAGRDSRAHLRAIAGLVFQNPDSQIVASTVEDDIAFGLENLGLAPGEIQRRVDEMVARFGLEAVRRREPNRLSGGQKQCAILAGVMAMAPRLLVLDEPTSMLDPRSGSRFRELVDELHRLGTAVVYITNVMEEAVAAPRLLALSSGRLAFDGSPAGFFSNKELLAETGITAPLPVRLSNSLAARGCKVPVSLTIEELVRQACASI